MDVGFLPIHVALQHVKAGKLVALGIGSERRHALLPDLPTLSEARAGDITVGMWYGIFAPPGTPPDLRRAPESRAQGHPRTARGTHGLRNPGDGSGHQHARGISPPGGTGRRALGPIDQDAKHQGGLRAREQREFHEDRDRRRRHRRPEPRAVPAPAGPAVRRLRNRARGAGDRRRHHACCRTPCASWPSSACSRSSRPPASRIWRASSSTGSASSSTGSRAGATPATVARGRHPPRQAASRLYEAVRERLGAGRVHLGSPLHGCRSGCRRRNPAFQQQQGAPLPPVRADVVVACDGVNSAVRRQFYPDEKLAFGGINTWRGVTLHAPDPQRQELPADRLDRDRQDGDLPHCRQRRRRRAAS